MIHSVTMGCGRTRPVLSCLRHRFATCTSVLIGLSLLGGTIEAMPAYDKPFDLRQPDGTRMQARLGGDEHFNWVAVDDLLVAQGADGFWRYVERGPKTAGQRRAGIDPVPADAAGVKDVPALRKAALVNAPGGEDLSLRPGPGIITAPSGPTEPMLVLLVQFTNRTFTTTEAAWVNSMFGTSGKTVRTYYDQVSRNTFRFTPAAESYGTANDGVVMVTLGYAHPNTGGTIDDRNRQIVRNALIAADSYVNFASFDTDHNGGLSRNELHVVTVVAGYERSYSSSYTPNVWGHRWSLFGAVSAPLLDGVYISSAGYNGGYTQQGELHGGHMGTIGILCHELGHDIGLPDLYDTDGSSNGVGYHCLMGSGSWGSASGDEAGATPVVMSAWSRIQMGFLVPTTPSGNGPFTAVQASDPASGNAFKIATANPLQYFLIENRQLTGFDAGLYSWFSWTAGGAGGGGLAVWHIDESMGGNTNEARKLVDLEEANEALVGGSELDARINPANRHHYYYSGHVTRFNNATTPNSRLYDGSATGLAVGNVSASGAGMTFTLGEVCTNGVDDDGDSLADCADPDCAAQCSTPTPTSTPVATATWTPTFTPTSTPTATNTPTFTPTPTPTNTFTPTPTSTFTPTPTDTATSTSTNTPTATWTPTPTPTDTATATSTFTPTPPGPCDLVVSSLSAPSTSGAGRTITVTDTTKNQHASNAAAASTTRFYLSTNSIWDAADTPLASRAVPALAPLGVSSASTAVTIPSDTGDGTWYIVAKADADAAIAETSETNNTRNRSIKIGPDLTVSSLSAPSGSGAGKTVTVTDTTKNALTAGPADPSVTKLYLSRNGSWDIDDVYLGQRNVGVLEGGATDAGPTVVTIPFGVATGTWYIIAKADADDLLYETSQTNNTKNRSITIGPDLGVSSLSSPATAAAGATVTVSDSTRNSGAGDAGPSATRFYLSSNSSWDETDTPLASRAVPALAAGATSSGSTAVTIPADTLAGAWYIIARGDDGLEVPETRENNNTRSRAITVTGP